MSVIYFDNNSTTKLAPPALARMNEVLQESLSASAQHSLGRKAYGIVEEARYSLKEFLGAQNYDVIFTSHATEANNIVLCGSLQKDKSPEIFMAPIEHDSVFRVRPNGVKVTEIAVTEDGIIDANDLEKKLNEVTHSNFLVSLMLANNQTGAIQPVKKVAQLVHQKGGLIHSDIVCAAGKIPVNLEELNVDFATLSAHKFYGPQGVGAILVRKGLDLQPLMFGGGQEGYKRPGTVNVAAIAGLAEACKYCASKQNDFAKIAELRDFLESEIEKNSNSQEVKIFSKSVARLPNTSLIAIKNSDNQTQLINFDLNQIMVSTGPACSSGTSKPSRVLLASDVSGEFAKGAIRVSLGLDNTKEEIEKFVKVWKNYYNKLRITD